MSKKIFIQAENNHNILSSPEPEKMKVIIWGKELCNGAEWYDFLKCVEEKTRENDKLKQQLVEKDKEIAHLKEKDNYRLRYELAGADETITNLKQQLAEKQKTIDEINKEFVQAVHDWKALCAEKDKEIEKLKTKQKPIVMHSKEDYFQRCNFLEEENIKLHFAQKQLAIQELEKVKNKCDGMYDLWLNSKYKENMYDNEDIAGVFDDISVFTNDLIKKLKGE